jgi:hypothetical protein
MSERIEAEMISRRAAFWLLGAGAAFGFGMPAAVLTASDAATQTPGMERREERREGRQERREDRRDNRQERRGDRRDNRDERREDRQGRREDRRGTVGEGDQ